MVKQFVRVVVLGVLVVAGSFGIYKYEQKRSARAQYEERIQKLEEQKKHLQDFVGRLTVERRAADVLVTDQVVKNGKVESTTLMFVEYARDGVTRLPPKFFTIKGKTAHIDALVVKFEDKFVEMGDGLRGKSLVLFYRVFDEYRVPSEGFPIDQPGREPEFYRPNPGQSPEANQFEAELWRDFWKLMDDAAYRAQKGVKLVQGEGLWRHFYPDEVYTVSHSAAGGLSISARPIDGLWKEYRDAVKRQQAS